MTRDGRQPVEWHDRVVVRRALVSVSDKTGLVELARFLVDSAVSITATGGSGDYLRRHGIPVEDLESISSFRELLGGRVKSLHPAVHAAILANRDDKAHIEDLQALGIEPFDLIVGNLYSFESVAGGRWSESAAEAVDIGGPAMLRAAAKNHKWVTAVMDPADYSKLIDEMCSAQASRTHYSFRQRMAAKIFARISEYDSEIAASLAPNEGDFPPQQRVSLELVNELRYGENPSQKAAFYGTAPFVGLAGAQQLAGPELGFNNIMDADAALSLVSEFEPTIEAACAIIKHGAPCGAACAQSLTDAFERARAADPISAFGGVIGLNRKLDLKTAESIAAHFFEIVVAPGAAPEALQVVSAKGRLRVISASLPTRQLMQWRSVSGGILVQDAIASDDPSAWKVVTEIQPIETQRQDLEFAWKVAKHARSNAVVVAAHGGVIGIGSGRTSRVDAAMAAAKPLDDRLSHRPDMLPVAASDGFFPFADGVEVLAKAGVKAIIQPGGSKRDAEVIAAANQRGMTMILTYQRQFRH